MENILSISRSTNKVTNYYNVNNNAGYFVDNNYQTPREGYPVYPILAFAWAGLEGTTGNPLGKLEGRASDNYKAINEAPAETLVNKGSAVPTMYGALQPLIAWKKWKFSFTVSGKFGYSFRRSSINYSDPYSTRIMGRNDFSRRWQKKGDQTNVPSMQISNSADRDLFYAFSEILVEKGDHLRLQDVRLEYDFRNMVPKTWKVQSITAYIYAANLGTIWTANKLKIDPDYLLGPPVPKSITAGFSFEF
jgi:TonB-dependent starch-binding outer membrane protein SusC